MTSARGVSRAIVACAMVFLGAASAASAVTVTLPTTTGTAGADIPSTISIGTVSNLEAVAISFTFDNSIVTVSNVGLGSVTATCNSPVVNLTTPGRATITLACTTPVSGSGSLFSITFHGVANGVAALTFSATGEVPNGCQLNEGNPTCEPSNGQITIGPVQPTNTVTPTATAANTSTATATLTAANTGTATGTVTNTPTRTATATATDTFTIGPSPTPSNTRTVTSTPTETFTSPPTNTPTITATASQTATPSATPSQSATRTSTATVTATPIPTPRITSGAVGGSTRVFGSAAHNIAAPGIEIVAENGNQVIGTGGTNGSGSFTDGQLGIGLTRPLVAGERIFPRDTVNDLTGPSVTVGPQPPTEIPALDEYGMTVLGTLLALALAWRLAVALRRRS